MHWVDIVIYELYVNSKSLSYDEYHSCLDYQLSVLTALPRDLSVERERYELLAER